MSPFFHRIMRCFRSEYFERLSSITLCFRVGFRCIPRSSDGHEVGKRATRSENTVQIFPFEKAFDQFIDLKLHEGKARGKFISVNRTVDSRSHHGTKNGVLIEASKKLIVEMRVVRFCLVIEDFLE